MKDPDLPVEIMLEIFSKLPTKSVGKCRTLSRSWNTRLSTTNFIKKHLINRQLTGQPGNFALITNLDQLFIITSPNINDQVENRFLKCQFGLGSCNGLILLKDDLFLNEDRYLMLVNPITLKMVKIQPFVILERRPSRYYYSKVYGFGYDSCSDDYKVVRLETLLSKNGDAKTFVDCYSVKTGFWKMLDYGGYPFGGFVPLLYLFRCGAFVNGAVHWLIGSTAGCPSCVAAFDLANESFCEIPLPKEFVVQHPERKYGVFVVGGCLMIVNNLGNGVIDIWIMKEYGVAESWVKSRIGADGINRLSIVAPWGYIGDGELLCLASENKLCACDLKRGTIREVEFGEREKRNIEESRFLFGMAFVDSLVSPEGSSWMNGGNVDG